MMLGSVLHELRFFGNKHDDDLIDRYNHRYTVMLLSIFLFIIASKQYFGEPIVCWTPAQFTGSHNAYANTVCWTHGTYPVTGDQPYHTVDRNKVLPYYQWVPFILLFQAVCFMAPMMLWHSFGRASGVDISSLCKNAVALDNYDMEKREKTISQIARHIHIGLSLKYDYRPTIKSFNLAAKLPFGRKHGNFLYIIYMFVKLVYIGNLVGQLFLMNSFFGFQYHSYGFEFLRKFLKGDDYSRIDKGFPRVTFCDFKIRNMADNIHQHSVQCALPINLFNEKFFICLWFWLLFLGLFTCINFFSWFRLLHARYRKKSIAKYLRAHHKLGHSEKDRAMFDTFCNDYCHLDGAFIFSLLRRNSNYITTSEIVCTLWARYCREYVRTHHMIMINEDCEEQGKPLSNGVDIEHVKIGMYDYQESEKVSNGGSKH